MSFPRVSFSQQCKRMNSNPAAQTVCVVQVHTRQTEERQKHWCTDCRGNIIPLCSWRCLRKNWVIFLSAADVCWWQLRFQKMTSFQLLSVVIQPIECCSLYVQAILKHSWFLFRTIRIHYKHLNPRMRFFPHKYVSTFMKKTSKNVEILTFYLVKRYNFN